MSLPKIKQYSGSDHGWGHVIVKYQGLNKKFPWHEPTGQIFNDDSKAVIWFKCLSLTMGTPILTVGRVVYHLAMTIFHLARLAYEGCKYLCTRQFNKNICKDLSESFADIFRSAIYGLGMSGMAVFGLIPCSQYYVRMYFGKMEFILNRKCKLSEATYIAPCFQPIGDTNHPELAKRLIAQFPVQES